MEAKEIATKILNDIEVKGKEQFNIFKASVDILVDFIISVTKQDILSIADVAQFEDVVKEILEIKVTNNMIDELIRLPATLEWTDDVAIKVLRPIAINFLISLIIKQLVERFGGKDWFVTLKQSIQNLPDGV